MECGVDARRPSATLAAESLMQRSRLAFAALVPALLLSLLALPAQAAGKEPSAEEIVEKALNRGAVGF